MFADLWPWSKREERNNSRRHTRRNKDRRQSRSLQFEVLEDRTVPAGHSLASATQLSFNDAPIQSASVSDVLGFPAQIDIFRVSLAAGDRVTAAIEAANAGSPLDSVLRVFDSTGRPLFSNDNFDGRDPRLTFQAAQAGEYFIGVSAAGNDNYDPSRFVTQVPGSTSGRYELTVSRVTAGLQADLVGARFSLDQSTAVVGDQLLISYTIENRGGAATGSDFAVNFRFSGDNRISTQDIDLGTVRVGSLAAGASFSSTFAVSLSELPENFQTGRGFIGAILDADGEVAELDEGNNFAQRQGTDTAGIFVVNARQETEQNDTAAQAGSIADLEGEAVDVRIAGTISAGDRDLYRVQLGADGRFTVRVEGAEGVDTRLRLLEMSENLLVESSLVSLDNLDDVLVQHLEAGRTYFLEVTSRNGIAGGYTLTTTFEQATRPFDLVTVGNAPRGGALADFNGDAVLDLAVTNNQDGSLTILLGLGDGSFRYAGDDLRLGFGGATAVVAGYFNNDNYLDLAVAITDFVSILPGGGGVGEEIAILLGNGDGTFDVPVQDDLLGRFEGDPLRRLKAPGTPVAITLGDFNRDGIQDLATANNSVNAVEVFLGLGDGGFSPVPFDNGLPFQFTVRGRPSGITSGQFNDDNNDGRVDDADFRDLVVSNQDSSDVSLLLGLGNGYFQEQVVFTVGNTPGAILAAQLNDDNGDRVIDQNDFLDVVTANTNLDLETGEKTFRGDLSVLLGNGQGSFAPSFLLPAGAAPRSLAVGDFTNSGRPNLVAANTDSGDLTVNLSRQLGQFGAAPSFAVGAFPFFVATGDLDNDGRLDLISVNDTDTRLDLFDLVEDDFADANSGGNVTVLRGRGDGTFQTRQTNSLGAAPQAIASADFNNDGRIDTATVNSNRGLSILLGQGDGTFEEQQSFRVGGEPIALVVGDFNRDRRTDVAVALSENTVALLLGNGDGTFRDAIIQAAGFGISSLTAGQFNDDNADGAINDLDFLDLATGNQASRDVSILLGNGDGTFRDRVMVRVDSAIRDIVAGQFTDDNNDGRVDGADFLDLVTAASSIDGGGEVILLRGNGTGGFTADDGAIPYGVGNYLVGVVAGFFNNDQFLDLAATGDGSVTILLNNGDGTFRNGNENGNLTFTTVGIATDIATGDFNADGVADLGILNGFEFPNVTVLLGAGDGTFRGNRFENGNFDEFLLVPASPSSGLVAADLNGDGQDDLATASTQPNTVSVQLGTFFGDDLAFIEPVASLDVRSTPILADLTGDGRQDSVVLARDGRIFLRRADSDLPGSFASPLVINRDRPARAITLVRAGAETLLAATDQTANRVTLYRFNPDGSATQAGEFAIDGGSLLLRVVSADLRGDGDGFDDLAVLFTSNGRQRIGVFLADGPATFEPMRQIDIDGLGPVDLQVADLDGDGVSDLFVTNQASGDVTLILIDNENDTFSQRNFRASTGLVVIGELFEQGVRSLERTGSTAAGDFNRDGIIDLVSAAAGDNSIGLLLGAGAGDFVNARRIQLGFTPTLVSAGQLSDDNADGRIDQNDNLDLAFLDAVNEQVHVFLGDGQGGFTERFSMDPVLGRTGPLRAGTTPTGLSILDADRDGRLDLQVGNVFGDVLTLRNRGDGTFEPSRRTGDSVPLATADFNNDGFSDLLVADQSRDQIMVLLRNPGTNTFTVDNQFLPRTADTLGPVAPVLSDINNDGRMDIIVANSGGNSITVFMTRADGRIQPVSFFAGSSPSNLQVAQLNDDNGDGLINATDFADVVVANTGSNDVSVLFGQGRGDTFTLIAGPRLNAGNGPVNVEVVGDVVGNDGISDLRVTNGMDGTFSLLPGIGSDGTGTGFFNDTAAKVVTASDPGNNGNAPIILTPGGSLPITASGAILNPATGQSVFFDGTSRVTFAASILGTPIPSLIAAFEDGTISLLQSLDGISFTETAELARTGLADLSALALNFQGDALEIIASRTGDQLPLVFGVDVGVLSPFPGIANVDLPAAVAAAGVGDSSLFVVPSLLRLNPLGEEGGDEGASALNVVPELPGLGFAGRDAEGRDPRDLTAGGDPEKLITPPEVILNTLVNTILVWLNDQGSEMPGAFRSALAGVKEAYDALSQQLMLWLDLFGMRGAEPLQSSFRQIGSDAADLGRTVAEAFRSYTMSGQPLVQAPEVQPETPALPDPFAPATPGTPAEESETSLEADDFAALMERDQTMAALLSSAVFALGVTGREVSRRDRRRGMLLGV